MNTFSGLLAVALLAYSVSASPCTVICNGKCSLQKKTCDFSTIFGKLCDVVNGVCTKSCEAACGCADSCAAKCNGKYATCKADGKGLFSMYNCGINLSVCSASCHTQCNFGLFASIVESLGKMGGSMGGDDIQGLL